MSVANEASACKKHFQFFFFCISLDDSNRSNLQFSYHPCARLIQWTPGHLHNFRPFTISSVHRNEFFRWAMDESRIPGLVRSGLVRSLALDSYSRIRKWSDSWLTMEGVSKLNKSEHNYVYSHALPSNYVTPRSHGYFSDYLASGWDQNFQVCELYLGLQILVKRCIVAQPV